MSRRGHNPDDATVVFSAGVLIVAILFAGWLASLLAASPAGGQSAGGDTHRDPQLTLARAAVAECGWKRPDCHAAAWHMLANRPARVAGRRTLQQVARDYCAAWDGSNDDNGRARWVRSLRADMGRPAGWPSRASWARHRRLWRSVYLRAGDFLAGEVSNPCNGRPVHMGGQMDAGRMRPDRWRALACGDTGGQRFYAPAAAMVGS